MPSLYYYFCTNTNIQTIYQGDKLMMPNINSNQQTSLVRKIIKQLEFNSTQNNFHAHSEIKYKKDIQEQLLNRHKKNQWIQPGYANGQFSKTLAMRGRVLDNWEIQRIPLATRSFQNPKNFKGMKYDSFSRQFPKDLSNTYSNKFQQHLQQIRKKFQNKVHKLKVQDQEKRRLKSIQTIKSKGYRFQLSKDKLFGFVNLKKTYKSAQLEQKDKFYNKQFSKTSDNYFKRQ